MATGAVCGSTGSVSLGGEILEWTLNELQDTIDATNMQTSGGFREYIACLKSCTGTFTSNIPVAVLGAHAAVDFVNAKNTYTGNIIITSNAKKVIVSDKVGYTYSWESTGAFSIS
jgi:hypothetical protein